MAAFAQGLGAAGEGIRQGEKLDIAKSEAESKQALRESQASAAEARAGAAGSRSEAAASRLALQQEHERGVRDRAADAMEIRAHQLYQAHVRSIDAKNKAIDADNTLRSKTNQVPRLPVPSPEEWLANNPGVRNTLEMARAGRSRGYAGSGGGGGSPGATGYKPYNRGDPEPEIGDPREVGGRAFRYRGNGQWEPI